MDIRFQWFLNDFLMTKQGDSKKTVKKSSFVIEDHFKHINRVSSKITESLGYTMIYEIIEKNQELKNIGNKQMDGAKYMESVGLASMYSFNINIYPTWEITKQNFDEFLAFKRDYVGRMMSKRGKLDTNFNMEVLRLAINDISLKFQ